MKATIWHNPNCGTSRKTLAALEEAGADVTVVENGVDAAFFAVNGWISVGYLTVTLAARLLA